MKRRHAGLGETLRRLRKERNLTQRQLAEAAGTDHTHLSRVESGERTELSRDLLDRLGEVLGAGAELAAAAGRLPARLEQELSQYPAAFAEDVLQGRTLRGLSRLQARDLAGGLLARTPGGAIAQGRIDPDRILRELRRRVQVARQPGETFVAITRDSVTIQDPGGPDDEGRFPRVRFLKAHAASHILADLGPCKFPRMEPGGPEELACDIAAYLLCPATLLDDALRGASIAQAEGAPGAWATDTGTLIADISVRLGVSTWLAVRRLADEALLDDEALYYSLGDRP